MGPDETRANGPPSDPDRIEEWNIWLVKRFHEEVLAQHADERRADYLSATFAQHHPVFGQGVPGFELFAQFLRTFRDLTCQVDVAFAEADRVMVMAVWRGRQFGSGKRLKLRVVHVYRIEHGHLAEHWAEVDYRGLESFGTVRPARYVQPSVPAGRGDSGAQRSNRLLLAGVLDEVLGNRDEMAVGRYVGADFVSHDLMSRAAAPGTYAHARGFLSRCGWLDLFPDASCVVHNVVAGHDHVGALLTWSGTERRTGRKLSVGCAEIFRASQARLAEHWSLRDYSALRTVGITPPGR